MSARQPVVGGVAGGVGTSLIAALIGAQDAGVVDDQSPPVDVLVCRSVSSAISILGSTKRLIVSSSSFW